MRAVVLFIVLAGYWYLLSGQSHKLFFAGSGVVCCLFTVYMCVRLKIIDSESLPLQALLGLITFIPWIIWQVILSNLHVAKIIWSPGLQINPQVFKVPLKTKTAFGASTYANSITLTPGTVTITVDGDEMLIHALDDVTADDLKTDEMHKRVQRMEGAADES